MLANLVISQLLGMMYHNKGISISIELTGEASGNGLKAVDGTTHSYSV